MLIDSSVLIRTLQPHHSLYTIADRAIRLLPEQGRELHIVAQNLIELWTVATRPLGENGLGLSAANAAAELRRIKSMFLFLPETPAIYPAWEALVTQYQVMGKPAHDARLVAAMQAHNLTAILTFDKTGFSRYPGIEVVHPEQVNA
jgi:predicted nucleic acid-binding protein